MAKNNPNLPKSAKEHLEYRQAILVALIAAVASVIVAAIPAYFAGKQQGKETTAVKSVENQSRPIYQDEIRNKENEIIDKQNQILSLGKTIDFLMGKVDKYENQLKVPGGRIILYEHIDYKGHGCYLRLGDDASDLRLYGFGNTVSSIKVEGNIKARAYSGINYSSSPPLQIDHSMASLDDYWNDRILSIIVEEKDGN